MLKTAFGLFAFLALVMLVGCGDGGGGDMRLAGVTIRNGGITVRLLDAAIARGAQGTVTVRLDALGSENALGFSIQFDPAQLHYESAQLGPDAAGVSLLSNTGGIASGRLGFMLGKPLQETFPAGTLDILLITFTAIDPGAGTVEAPLTFTDNPVAREVVDAAAGVLPAGWLPGTVTITGGNTPPVADSRSVQVNEGVDKAITLTGSDADGDALTYLVVDQPQHGTLAGAAPNLIYSPDADYTGEDGFTFTVNDGQADSPVATISITIDATPRHPADYNPDNPAAATSEDLAIDIAEITHYGNHWKSGQSWPRGPDPIDIAYLTNAGFLWRSGERYGYDAGAGEPNCWTPAVAAAQARFPGHTGRNSATARFSSRSYTPGKGMRVTIELQPAPAALAVAVQEQPPAGWIVSAISHDGAFDAATGLVKWGPFFDRAPRALSFTATPPPGESGMAAFSGVLSVDGRVFPITGDRQSKAGRRR